MNNGPNKKSWFTGVVKIHVDPTPIRLIISQNDTKSENDFVIIKLSCDPMSE